MQNAELARWRKVFEELRLSCAMLERIAPAFRLLDQIASDDLRALLTRATNAG